MVGFALFCLALFLGAWTLSKWIGREQDRNRSYGGGNDGPIPG